MRGTSTPMHGADVAAERRGGALHVLQPPTAHTLLGLQRFGHRSRMCPHGDPGSHSGAGPALQPVAPAVVAQQETAARGALLRTAQPRCAHKQQQGQQRRAPDATAPAAA